MIGKFVSIALTVALGVGGAFAAKPEASPPKTSPVEKDALPSECACVPAMTNERIARLLLRLDENVAGRPGLWQLTIRGRRVLVITDERADRMRIISGVAKAEGLDPKLLFRAMQANFDSGLDARYGIAKEALWSAFIHPLGSLSETQLVSGLAQVVNLAATFGTTYSSGGLTFGGGDSDGLIRELLDRAQSI